MIQSTIPTRVNAKARSMKGKPRRNPRGLQSSSHILLLNFSSLSVKIHSEPHFVIDPSSPSAASRPARICKRETKLKTKSLPTSRSLRFHRSSSSSDTRDGNTQNRSRSSCITVRNGQGHSGSSYITLRNGLTWRLCMARAFFTDNNYWNAPATLQVRNTQNSSSCIPFRNSQKSSTSSYITFRNGWLEMCVARAFYRRFSVGATKKERKGKGKEWKGNEKGTRKIWTFWTHYLTSTLNWKWKELNGHQDSSVELFFSVGQLLETAIERLEWTSSHQCTSSGWGCSSRFGDEPKHIQPGHFYFPLPLPRVFSALCPKVFPSYLPPLP